MKYEYTQELDDILLKYGKEKYIVDAGYDLVREWEIGETIDTKSGFNRLARLENKEGDYVAVFPWCVFFGNEDGLGCHRHWPTETIVAIGKLCAEVDKYIDRIEQKGDE